MLRMLALILVFASYPAVATAGEARGDLAMTVESARQTSRASVGTVALARTAGDDLRLWLKRGLAAAEATARAVAAGRIVLGGAATVEPTLSRPAQIEPEEIGVPWLHLSGAVPELAYSFSDQLSLGLSYRYLRGEEQDLSDAELRARGADFASHEVLLRAHWEF